MSWLIHKITNNLVQLSQSLIVYGPFGLFAIALLDSAFVPLPGGPDAVMMLLAAARPRWTILYAVAATLGSVAGCIVLYYISRRVGEGALKRFSPAKQARVKSLMDRYDVLAVLVASILPPPFPFKLFVVTAGVLRLNILRFVLAIAAGRFFRFLLEGYLAACYGERARDLLAEHYPTIGISLAVLLIALFVGRNLLWRERTGIQY
ncbi:MAG: DedA family protein [Pyrinomonadaceae bacterium]|nr:DedA family protein [Pyrinomonadaceae bacterium]